MFTIGNTTVRNCSGVTRREMLRVGGLSLAGLTLADFLRSTSASPDSGRREAACIFLWLDGGPSHFETFDPKPDTPDTVRGPYAPIQTNVNGIQICELLPRLAQQMDKCVLVRSMNHGIDAHSPVPMLTGFQGETTSYGAVIARIQGYRGNMPPYVHVGSRLGVGGGRLGAPFSSPSKSPTRPAIASNYPSSPFPRTFMPIALANAANCSPLSIDFARGRTATMPSNAWISRISGPSIS